MPHDGDTMGMLLQGPVSEACVETHQFSWLTAWLGDMPEMHGMDKPKDSSLGSIQLNNNIHEYVWKGPAYHNTSTTANKFPRDAHSFSAEWALLPRNEVHCTSQR